MPEDTPKPRFTQHLTMHLTGGRKFSELHYEIRADGAPTGITRHKRTSGGPRYLLTADVFRCGDDSFDVLAARGVGLDGWLAGHAGRAGSAS